MNKVSDNIEIDDRLNHLFAIAGERPPARRVFRGDLERMDEVLMRNPLTAEKTFALFGLMLGIFPPAAIYFRLFREESSFSTISIFFLVAIAITALVGYWSGKVVGSIVRSLEQTNWIVMTLALTIIGGAWGLVSGATGGFVLFIFGALFGGVYGMIVAAFALPIFSIFHRLLSDDGYINDTTFLPLGFGVSLTISAFIFGF